jgi:hypothetical protein
METFKVFEIVFMLMFLDSSIFNHNPSQFQSLSILLICFFVAVNCELLPLRDQEQTQPYLPNVITSVKQCSLRHYKWGKSYSAAPVGGVVAFLREFPHLVNSYSNWFFF